MKSTAHSNVSNLQSQEEKTINRNNTILNAIIACTGYNRKTTDLKSWEDGGTKGGKNFLVTIDGELVAIDGGLSQIFKLGVHQRHVGPVAAPALGIEILKQKNDIELFNRF